MIQGGEITTSGVLKFYFLNGNIQAVHPGWTSGENFAETLQIAISECFFTNSNQYYVNFSNVF